VIGVGLNVGTLREEFPEELRETATSLVIESGVDPGVEAVLDAVLASLDHWLAQPADGVLDAWRSRDVLRDQRIRWNGGEGQANGIDKDGGLIVSTDSGQVVLDAGEVHLQRTP
jgi:BirA family biotin operon repressor/biotin-[acetyl-CoA-carboxylase] ligase